MPPRQKGPTGLLSRVQESAETLEAALLRERQLAVDLIAAIDSALAGIRQAVSSGARQRPRRIIDLAENVLKDTDHALPRDSLIQKLAEIGAAAGRRDSVVQIEKSIDYNSIGKRMKGKYRLKIKNGLIGLSGWEDEKRFWRELSSQ